MVLQKLLSACHGAAQRIYAAGPHSRKMYKAKLRNAEMGRRVELGGLTRPHRAVEARSGERAGIEVLGCQRAAGRIPALPELEAAHFGVGIGRPAASERDGRTVPKKS